MRITQRPITSWIFYRNTRWQLLLLGVILVTVVARVFPLEMQKRIINEAIGLGLYDKLLLYCGLYLGAVLLASSLKYVINALQVYLGQKTLMHIREELYRHILSLPLSFFRQTQPGMVVSTLVGELASVAEFVGSALAVPAVNILTILAFAGYMFYLEPILAGLSFAIYPFELLVIPRLQKKTNQANRERVRLSRKLSGIIGETVTGIHEVHGNASYHIEGDKFKNKAGELYRANIRMSLYRYGVKVANNLFQNIGPFFLFLVGGYLTINGRFDLGALVAFLSAYEKVYDPWKELMDFYQLLQDSTIRYRQVMDYFDHAPEHALEPEGRSPHTLVGNISLRDVYYTVSGNIRILDRVSLDVQSGEQLALVGFSGSGKSSLALVIAQLYDYSAGNVLIDGHEVSGLTKSDMAANIGIVAQHPFIFSGTIRDNLLYSCVATPGMREEDLPDLDRTIEVIQQVGLFRDVLRFGTTTVLPRDTYPELEKRLVRVRHEFQNRFGTLLAEDVEFFDETRYLQYSSVAGNIIFGDPVDDSFAEDRLHANADFLKFLDREGLEQRMWQLGARIARETVDILGNLPRTPELFESSPIAMDDFEDYQELVRELASRDPSELNAEQRNRLLELALNFTPGIHKVVALPEDFQQAILKVRGRFKEWVKSEHIRAVVVSSESQYIHSQNILNNILFGKLKDESGGAQERVARSLIQLLIGEELLEKIVEIGLTFEVGSMGDRLSGGQRQKVALARAFLKAPPILILDEATSALDNASQTRIQNLLQTRWKNKATVISVVHRLDTLAGYDRVAVMKSGQIIEFGTYQELLERKGVLYELVNGTQR